MKIERIDMHPHGGVAGDMFAAAMSDAFPEIATRVIDDINALQVQGLSGQCADAMSAGLRALRFDVTQNTDLKPPRTLAAVIDFLGGTKVSQSVADVAIAIYRLLAQAEADVHGKTIETIHFHEVSDWDSMVDIVAAAGFISRIDCAQWRLAPLPLGGGTVNTAHGDIPVPAPATLALLDGFDWIDDGVPGERVTPTGAAIMRYLQPDKTGGSSVPARLATTGQGCGTRELPGRANVFRISVYADEKGGSISDTVTRLAFEIDDMTGEELAAAMDQLRADDAVLDLTSIAMSGKKGRPVTGFRLLVVPESADQIMDKCFEWTTTLGIRHHTVQRRLLARTGYITNAITVKATQRPSGAPTAKAESDDLAHATSLADRRRMAQQVEREVVETGKFD